VHPARPAAACAPPPSPPQPIPLPLCPRSSMAVDMSAHSRTHSSTAAGPTLMRPSRMAWGPYSSCSTGSALEGIGTCPLFGRGAEAPPGAFLWDGLEAMVAVGLGVWCEGWMGVPAAGNRTIHSTTAESARAGRSGHGCRRRPGATHSPRAHTTAYKIWQSYTHATQPTREARPSAGSENLSLRSLRGQQGAPSTINQAASSGWSAATSRS